MSRLVAREDFSFVVFDNAFANRKAKSRAVRFSMRGEWLKKFVCDFRRNSRSRVFQLSNHLVTIQRESQNNLSAVGHGFDGVVDEVVENPGQSAGIDLHSN